MTAGPSSEAFFDQVAGQWDELRASMFSDALRDRAIDEAGISPGMLAADIGAGSGFMTEGLIKRGVRVIAVDQSEAMLDVIRQKFGADGAVDVRRGYAHDIPISDDDVDHVFANMYLHHVEKPAHAIREMVRILKPGGKLVITDMDEHRFDFLRAEHHDRWMGFRREDVRSWLEQAGLTEVSVGASGETCETTSAAESNHATVSVFIASGIK